MIEVDITGDMLAAAAIKAEKIGVRHNSILRGAGNVAGALGELAVAQITGAVEDDTLDNDLITSGGLIIEVKSKQTNYKPKPHYEVSVSDFNPDQQCDIYFFTRVLYNMTKAYVLGYYPRDMYFIDSTFMCKGTFDPSNGYKVRADCHNIAQSKLFNWTHTSERELLK